MSGKGLYAVATGLGVTGLVALGLLFGVFEAGPTAVTGGEAREGIAVHGHWTIEVRDPDGGLVERREFDNALVMGGSTALALVAAGLQTSGVWWVDLDHGGAGGRPCAGGTLPCRIIESAAGGGGHVFSTLTVSVPNAGPDTGKLVLSGTATADNDTLISFVQTTLSLCDPAAAPITDCVGGSGIGNYTFTQASVSPAVSIVSGQQILVTVIITFS